jgi:hypothetical protein
MSTVKRRKVDIGAATRSSARGIASFARITKAQSIGKDVLAKTNVLEAPSSTTISVTVDGKRKQAPAEDEVELETSEQASHILQTINAPSRPTRPLPARRATSRSSVPPKTPHRPIDPQSSLPPPAEDDSPVPTPTKGARALLDRFMLQSSPQSSQLSETFDIEIDEDINSSQTSICSTPEPQQFPQLLQDQINLHSSFLTALTLHYAHNGTHTPADLRLLCPAISSVWGKRRVLLTDVKRLLGVLNYSPTSEDSTDASFKNDSGNNKLAKLSLVDYGMGKVCIEIVQRARSKIAKPLDEVRMNAIFEDNLKALWEQHLALEENIEDEETMVKAFLESLPAEGVTVSPCLSKMSPLLARGQRRLEDMKRGITFGSPSKNSSETEADAKDAAESLKPKLTLLERLRLKSQAKANAPPPPSPEALARKAALGRAEEVLSVIRLLSTSGSKGQSRVSFTMGTVVGRLRDSMRNGISPSEAEGAIRIAAEVLPEGCKIIEKPGRKEGILVVDREGWETVPDDVVQKRIANAVASVGC